MPKIEQSYPMDADVKTILKSHGYDVEQLRKKYTNKGLGTTASYVGGTVKRSNGADSSATSQSEINDIYICKSCQGQGIVKDIYNHVVRERNCDVCEGEGVLWLDKSKGQLVPISQRKR